MSNLPFTLPTCDQPATVRLEVYSPAGGELRGSLDAAVYTCEQHALEAVSAVYAAGLTAHRVPLAPDVTRTCGHVHAFPTAGPDVASPADPEHPTWCDRKGCERRAEHRSAVAHIDTNRPEATILDVALIQALHPAAAPMLSLTSIEGPAAEHVIMSIGQGRALSYVLRRLIDLTKGGRR